ncbi:MAG: hypothetical protein ACRD0P_00010 [Stackebrandtia sp.]
MRALVLWCPGWPVIAACRESGWDETEAVAVLADHRVVVCSAAARRAGVEPGQRRRDAAAVCPRVRLVAADAAVEASWFEPVVAALAQLAPGIEVLRPGWCGLPVKGPAGWFGSEEAAGETFVEHVAQVCDLEVSLGIADGFWPASVAALSGAIVPPGGNARFLAEKDISVLALPELVDLLRRLGINTLGDFAALPVQAVAERLGAEGLRARDRARGRDERLPAPPTPPPDLEVSAAYDDPLDRVDAAAFAARSLAERLRAKLSGHELACTRLAVEAVTIDGTVLRRVWRHQSVLRPADVAERVRWQLDGWLRHGGRGAITELLLSPEGIVDGIALQDGLWGAGDGAERAGRTSVRMQGLFGPEIVRYPLPRGGRNLGDRVTLTTEPREQTEPRPLKTVRPTAASRTRKTPVDPQPGPAAPDPEPTPATKTEPSLTTESSHTEPTPTVIPIHTTNPTSRPKPTILDHENQTTGHIEPAPAVVPIRKTNTHEPTDQQEPTISGHGNQAAGHTEPANSIDRLGPTARRESTSHDRRTAPTVSAHEDHRITTTPRDCDTDQAGPGQSERMPPHRPVTKAGTTGDGRGVGVGDLGGRYGPAVGKRGAPAETAAGGHGPDPVDVDSGTGVDSGTSTATSTGTDKPAVGGRRLDPGERQIADPQGRPWPGAYPAPYPATVYSRPPRVVVADAQGAAIAVSGRGELSGIPDHIVLADGVRAGISAWAGPQPLDERWWDPERSRRVARLQLLLDNGRALVVVRGEEIWRLEAGYD